MQKKEHDCWRNVKYAIANSCKCFSSLVLIRRLLQREKLPMLDLSVSQNLQTSTWNFGLSHNFNIEDLSSPIAGLLDEVYLLFALSMVHY